MRGRIDANHGEIVKALRGVGASVQSLADLGKGAPDLLVGFRGRNWLFEVKDGSLPPSRQKLTLDEKKWRNSWRGHYAVATSPDEALREILGALN